MKRGKDDEKILEPMFPRLHVNDADKGGPRAPPRNKMALYEQLSIPSQRFGDHGTLSLNSRSNNTTTLVHPGSSNQVSFRRVFMFESFMDAFCDWPEHSGYYKSGYCIQLDKDIGKNCFLCSFMQQSCGVERNLSAQHLDSSDAVHVTENFVSQMPFMENMRSLAKHDQRKTVREEDDFAVPVFVNSRRIQSHGSTKSGIEIEKHTPLATCSKLVRDQVKRNAKSGGVIDLSSTEEMDLEKSASSYDRVNDCNASLRQESRNKLYRDGGEAHMKDNDNRVESHLVTESHSEEGHGSPDEDDNSREYCRSRGAASLQQINEDAEDDISDTSMVDSISSIDVCPDDVVGALGQKRFWRARKAITNQQRVFAVQLFELHRLIKVQRLIAASPDILLDEINYLGKVSAKSYPVNKLVPSEFIVKPPLRQVVVNKQYRMDSEKTDQHKMECSAENVVGRLSNQGHHNHQPSNYMPFPCNPPASPAVNGCCYPPQPHSSGNQQWLIPVMSPSEGLIYKPHPGTGHTGPYGGYYGHFMPPPMVMPPFHPGMGFPPPGNGFFPPYGVMPTMMNPYGSGQQQQPQANEQMNQFGYSGNLQNNTQQQSSVNEAAPPQQPPTKSYPRARKSRQGLERAGTASSTSGREGISGSTSFRPFSAVDEDNNNNNIPDQMMTTTTTTTRTTVTQTTRDGGVTRVIKVVPHNAKLASENAARIFQSIQEERKQHYDSFSNL